MNDNPAVAEQVLPEHPLWCRRGNDRRPCDGEHAGDSIGVELQGHDAVVELAIVQRDDRENPRDPSPLEILLTMRNRGFCGDVNASISLAEAVVLRDTLDYQIQQFRRYVEVGADNPAWTLGWQPTS